MKYLTYEEFLPMAVNLDQDRILFFTDAINAGCRIAIDDNNHLILVAKVEDLEGNSYELNIWHDKDYIFTSAKNSVLLNVSQYYGTASYKEVINTDKKAINMCPKCKKEISFNKQVRYSFQGRCCPDCLPEMQKEYEYPGWDK